MAKKENAEPITTNSDFTAGRRENTTKAPHISSASMGSISQPSKKVNSKTDTDYLSAVERGDMETAQKMVDEAAKKSGYGKKRKCRT